MAREGKMTCNVGDDAAFLFFYDSIIFGGFHEKIGNDEIEEVKFKFKRKKLSNESNLNRKKGPHAFS